VIEEHWDPTIADGLDLGEDPEPDFAQWDRVCFKDWPDFVYYACYVDGDATAINTEGYDGYDEPALTTLVPTAALRKVQQEPEPPQWAKIRNAEAVQRAIENLKQVNQRLRDN
jgi:hypothetical protein